MDSSVVRAHQHATNTSRHTGGLAELARTGSLSRPTMAWGAPGQGWARRSARWSTAAAGPWSFSWERAGAGRPGVHPPYGGFRRRAPGSDGPGRVWTWCAPTRGTPRALGAGARSPRLPWRARGCSSRARRGFACQIPVKEDQEAGRRRRGREYSFDPASYAKRNVVERAFASYRQWRALAARHGRTRHRPRSRPPHPHHPHLAHLRDTP